MPFDPRPYSTLRKIAAGAATLDVNCSRCGHSAPAPLEALAARIGWDTDFLAPDVLPFLRCSACGLSGRGRHPSGHLLSLKLSPNCPGMGRAENLSG